jgi:RNA polymerase sigma-70 factor (ECF subfamily)
VGEASTPFDRSEVIDEMKMDPQSASDANLVVSIARYREDALAELYRRHAGAVYGLARRVLWDVQLAVEVVQEVFLRIWTAPERYDPDRGSIRSYLLTQAHGRAVDLLRSEGSRKVREQRDAQQAAEAGYDLEREVWDLALADGVREAVSTLPDSERRAVELAYFRGYTYREVADLLGEPEGTIKGRIRSALRRLNGALVSSGILVAVDNE